MKSVFKNLFNQRGIALLIVLMSLMILTTSLVQFDYTERINYRMAVHAKQRLQAYYLARSALNFSKILLKYQKEADQALKSAGDAAGSMNVEPLYKMIPLSSELIRGVISGEITEISAGEEEEAGEEKKTPDEGEENSDEEKKIKTDASMLSKGEAEEFLKFEGDFLSEISEEGTKYDLNKIASVVSTSASYDQRKKLLYSFLKNPRFDELFEKSDDDREQLVHALSDWVDQNGVINEFENVQRGAEDSEYSGEDYKVKNGKMATLSEMRLVAGMNDSLFSKLKDYVTIYTASDKINLCLAEDEEWAQALIYHYTHNAACGSPVDYTDADKMSELVSALLGGCPDTDAMASALNSALGLTEVSSSDDEESTESSSSSSGSTVTGCAFQVSDLLTSDNKVFTVKATGTVDETRLTMSVVMNTDSSDPTKWKYYYYRVE